MKLNKILLVCLLFISCSSFNIDQIKELINKKEYDKAIEKINIAIENSGKSKELIKLRYRCFYNKGDYLDAKNDLYTLEALGEKSADFDVYFGNIFYKLNQVDSSLFYLNTAYSIDPNTLRLNYNLAVIYYQKFYKDSDALRLVSKEISLDNSNLDARVLEAYILEDLNNNLQALIEVDTILEMDKNNAGGYDAKAIAYCNLNKWKEGCDNYSIAIRLDSTNSNYYFGRACAYMNINNFPSAISDLNSCIALNSTNLKAYNLRASAYVNINNFSSAISDLNSSIALDSTNLKTYRQRAYCYREINKLDQACQDIEHIKKADPNFDIFSLKDLDCK